MRLARGLMIQAWPACVALSTPTPEVPVLRTRKIKSTKTPCFWLALLTAVMLAGVGGLLLLSNQWVRVAEAPRDQATPASLEMMQLLHDEHQLIGEMVKAQLAVPDSGFLDSKPMAAAERRQAIALR